MDRARVSLTMDDTGMVDEQMNVDYTKLMDAYPWKHAAKRTVREATEVLGRRPKEILDVGCGPAHLLCALADVAPDIELHGLDLSDDMLAIARKRLEQAGCADRVSLHRGSAYSLPFEDGLFDVVLSTDALHCFDDPRAFLSELHRVTRPDGVAIVHSWRRDAAWPIRTLGYLQTAFLKATGSHLEGGGPIFDASWTSDEVRQFARVCSGSSVSVKTGPVEMVTLIRRAPATS